MNSTTFRRGLALLLCAQPVFWMSNVALAQTLQPGSLATSPPSAAPALTMPVAPGETEVVRHERPMMAALPGLPAVDEPIDPDTYVCGPGDVLELNFWGLQNFKLRANIDLEGRAFVPKVGYFDLKGKTLTDARRMMRESVARYFPRLSFDVALAEPRTFLVQLVDDVARPGSYPARAIDRVGTLIARAGGFGPNASQRRVEIRRRDGKVLGADLLLYGLTGDVKHNPHLLDGDVVRVPFEDLAASVFGAVNRPGRYELTGTRDLVELVTLAGGLAPSATRLLPISLVRRLPDDRPEQKLLELTTEGGPPAATVKHEDIVRIPSFTEVQQSVTVIGAVAGAVPASAKAGGGSGTAPEEASATRRMPFVQGDSVRTLLERVGGVGPLADVTGSYILRDGTSIPVDLHALFVLRDLKADRPIELGDTVVVPFKRRNVLVEGAVFRPGEYPYNPTFGVAQYLSLAGGRNRFAKPVDDVRLVTPNGEMKEYRTELKIEPGSTLVVPERNFSRSEVVQIILGIATVVVSGVAVVLAAGK